VVTRSDRHCERGEKQPPRLAEVEMWPRIAGLDEASVNPAHRHSGRVQLLFGDLDVSTGVIPEQLMAIDVAAVLSPVLLVLHASNST